MAERDSDCANCSASDLEPSSASKVTEDGMGLFFPTGSNADDEFRRSGTAGGEISAEKERHR